MSLQQLARNNIEVSDQRETTHRVMPCCQTPYAQHSTVTGSCFDRYVVTDCRFSDDRETAATTSRCNSHSNSSSCLTYTLLSSSEQQQQPPSKNTRYNPRKSSFDTTLENRPNHRSVLFYPDTVLPIRGVYSSCRHRYNIRYCSAVSYALLNFQ